MHRFFHDSWMARVSNSWTWGVSKRLPSPCLLICIPCAVVCSMFCLYSCFTVGVDIRTVVATILCRPCDMADRFERSAGEQCPSQRSLAIAVLRPLWRCVLLFCQRNCVTHVGLLAFPLDLRSVASSWHQLQCCVGRVQPVPPGSSPAT